jgi:superfamily II DNA or RNA helicase
MTIDSKRLARQKSILRKWVSNDCRGTLEACTGFGKTYTAVIAIQKTNEQYPDKTILVVVPTKHLKTQWQAQVDKHQLTNVTVVVINTGIRRKRQCDLLILDEIHNYASSVFSQIFSCVRYQWVLGLTATLERNDGKDYLIRDLAPVVDTVTLVEALKEGYVSEFKTYNVPLILSDQQKAQYKKLSDEFNYYFSKFGHDFNTAMHCLKSNQACKNVASRYKVADNQARIWAIQFNRNLAMRKKFLYTYPPKLEAAKQIIEALDLKTITFSESIDFADSLTKMTQPWSTSYNSKMPKYRRAQALENFQDDKSDVRVINTAKALDEGFDVPGVEMALICSGTSSERQNIQRTGRAIRFQEGKTGYIVNLYVKDTQDEKWLRSRQKSSVNIIALNDVNDLLYQVGGIGTDQATIDLFR